MKGRMAAQNSPMLPILLRIKPQILIGDHQASILSFLSEPFSYLPPYHSAPVTLAVPQICQEDSHLKAFAVAVLCLECSLPYKSALISPLPLQVFAQMSPDKWGNPTTLIKIELHTPHPPLNPYTPSLPLCFTFLYRIYFHLTHNILSSSR